MLLLLTMVAITSLASNEGTQDDEKVTKILAIGNSFSVNAVEIYLWDIINADSVKAVVGNMYIPGCSINQHVGNARSGKGAYRYTKFNFDGEKSIRQKCSLEKALLDEDWDIVTVQQVSDNSGLYDTYGNLPELLDYIVERVPKKTKILFHQTWAYSQASKHPGFKKYDCSQADMYISIIETSERVTMEQRLDGIIPAGTAIQYARETELGDSLTVDGYHLNNTGCYAAACTWYEYIFGTNVMGNTFKPRSVPEEKKRIAQEAAHVACLKYGHLQWRKRRRR